GNVVAYNLDGGIEVWDTSQARISGNSTFANAGLGIDLNNDGVTKNDAGDADVGPNALLNAPVLTSANIVGTNLAVTGNARPGTTVELFTAQADGNSFGEGRTYLTSQTVPVEGPFAGSGKAISFSGAFDHVQLPAASPFSNFTGGMTVEAWVYPTAATSWSRIIDFGNGAASDNIL